MNANSTDLVLFAQDARGVVTLTLNRPQAFNALSEGLIEALHAALQRARLELAFACANPASASSGGATGGGSARLLLAYLPATFSPALRLDAPPAAAE
jgi:enoyl-CoA hydratase/carnithine racemase